MTATRAAVVDDLCRRLGQKAVVTDPDVLWSRGRDSATFCKAGSAVALVRPHTTAEVRQVVLAAGEHRVPLVTQGARTGLSGGANAVDGCVLLSTERLDQILELDVADQVAVVQPGVVNARLSRAVAEHGLFYPPDPSSWEESTIGGNVATNAGGLCCVKYGVTGDFVRGLEVVLGAGDVQRMARICTEHGAVEVAEAADAQEADLLLEARRLVNAGLETLGSKLVDDVAVPRPRLPELLRGIEEIAREKRVVIACPGHVGDGNMHPTVIVERDDPDAVRRAEEAFDAVMELGLRLGGTTTGEHGIGTLKRRWLERELGPTGTELHRRLREVFDPLGILNPGKVLAERPLR